MYDIEKLYQAVSVEDAISELIKTPESVIISGGSDVLIKIREGKLAGCSLVSIHGIKELMGVEKKEDDTIIIRPAASFTQIAQNPMIKECIPVLAEAVEQVGSPQIRNIGTIGGNVCNGVTSADSAAALFALNAFLQITGKNGKRIVPIEEFYVSAGKTILEHDEILTEIIIKPEDYKGFYGNYIKYGKRNAMEIATLGCVAVVKLTETKEEIESLRIAFGVAAPIPMRCKRTEESVRGMKIGKELYKKVAKGVLEEVTPRSSWRASKEFRIQLIEELSKRALQEAIKRAGGEGDV